MYGSMTGGEIRGALQEEGGRILRVYDEYIMHGKSGDIIIITLINASKTWT